MQAVGEIPRLTTATPGMAGVDILEEGRMIRDEPGQSFTSSREERNRLSRGSKDFKKRDVVWGPPHRAVL